jgi:predicted nucleic acid-binding protein
VPKYAIDSSVYIAALRDAGKAADLKGFLAAFLSSTFLSAVVVQELRAGALTGAQREAFHAIVDPFARRGRIFAPSPKAFEECGRILADLATRDGVKLAGTRRSFVSDILIATSCRENGVVLITNNAADFRPIRRHLPSFRFEAPWPARVG